MLWVVRDINNQLFFFSKKPVKSYGRYFNKNGSLILASFPDSSAAPARNGLQLPEALMPYVRFEDGPIRVAIKSLGK
jgi:hypothetical protein